MSGLPVRNRIGGPSRKSERRCEQIERFYARNLPLSREMEKNLQSFGERLDN
jgi:hypothetical protein